MPAEVETMIGEPLDIEGQCNAHLYIADNCGDNHATIRCCLPKGHHMAHQEIVEARFGIAEVTWMTDERDWERMVNITEKGITYHCCLCNKYKTDSCDYYLDEDGKEKICCYDCYLSRIDPLTYRPIKEEKE